MVPIAAAILAGLLLFAADHPLNWWPLQLCAFAPLLAGLWLQRRRGRSCWYLGAVFALAYVFPLVQFTGSALPIVVVAVATVVQWSVLAGVLGPLLVRGPVLGPLAAAAAVTAGELAIWNLVPMFGSGQCFARVLSAAPALVAFAAFTGLAGVVFALILVQGLAVSLFVAPARRTAIVLAATVGALAVLDVWRWHRPLGGAFRVAAIGWCGHPVVTFGTGTMTSNDDELRLVTAAVGSAAADGARLVVTPETGLFAGDRDAMLARLGDVAKQHGVHAAFGIWLAPDQANRIWLFEPGGRLVGEYTKTHLVPWLEESKAGDGTLLRATVDDAVWGGMICQDDNFSDLARGYGCSGAALVVVPTNDWDAIRKYHLDSSRFRAIENGYAVVRAASNGISAVISPRGELVARLDHTETPRRGILVADVPLGDGSITGFALWGDWPMLAVCVVSLLAALRRRSAAEATC